VLGYKENEHLPRVGSNLVLEGHITPLRTKTTMTTIRKIMAISAIVATTATTTTIPGVSESFETLASKTLNTIQFITVK